MISKRETGNKVLANRKLDRKTGIYLKVPNTPDHWEEDGTAADEVDEDKQLLPGVSPRLALRTLLHDNVRNIGNHLEVYIW